jgi:hypothetical protein
MTAKKPSALNNGPLKRLPFLFSTGMNQGVKWILLFCVVGAFGAFYYPGLVIYQPEYQVGDIADRDIKAPRDFFVEDKQITDVNRRLAVEQVLTVFKNPEDFVRLRKFSLTLNKMGILVGENSGQPCNELNLTEVTIGEGTPRIVTLARFPRGEILPPTTLSESRSFSPGQAM